MLFLVPCLHQIDELVNEELMFSHLELACEQFQNGTFHDIHDISHGLGYAVDLDCRELAFASRCGRWQEASELLAQAPLLRISPDVASYTSVIAAYAKHPQLWQKAFITLRSMPSGLPNVFSYGAAISAMARSSDAH